MKLNTLLSERFKKTKKDKVNVLAERSTKGELSGFSGIFNVASLSKQEESDIKKILESHKGKDQETAPDLSDLLAITSEVKAINNQAIILHGERIKKAQTILKKYRDGAFSAWLIATYGNRQTPYNFLQYYNFHTSLAPALKEKAIDMPKQAIYTLASREGDRSKKEALVKNYKGESKKVVLEKIRTIFPLPSKDKRQGNVAQSISKSLERLLNECEGARFKPSSEEKEAILSLLAKIEAKL